MSRDVYRKGCIPRAVHLSGGRGRFGGHAGVTPYYLHDYKAFGKITVLGELLAVAAVVMCILSFLSIWAVRRVMNVLLHP